MKGTVYGFGDVWSFDITYERSHTTGCDVDGRRGWMPASDSFRFSHVRSSTSRCRLFHIVNTFVSV